MAQGTKMLRCHSTPPSAAHLIIISPPLRHCPLLPPCMVQDTKMSRWHSTGPLAAVKEFLSRHPEFAVRLRASALSIGVHGLGLLSSQAEPYP